MFKNIIIGLLAISVIGAGGAAIVYNVTNPDADAASAELDPLGDTTQAQVQENAPEQAGEPAQGSGPVMAAEGMEGEPWEASGVVSMVDDFGFEMTLEDDETVYVELGPTDFWQAQGVELLEGELVEVTGSINEDGMIHAAQVMLENGETIRVRNEFGQPLWSGGIDAGPGNGSADGEHSPEPQVSVDEWITLEGSLMAFQGGNMTMATVDGEIINFKTGQPRFFASQGVTFMVGDEITILGYFDGDQFVAGEITQDATDLTVMLRDPNGRPLWAGPGNGNGNGGGISTQG